MMIGLPTAQPSFAGLAALARLGCGCSDMTCGDGGDPGCCDPTPCDPNATGVITGSAICYAGDNGSQGCQIIQTDCTAGGMLWNAATQQCTLPSGAGTPGGGSTGAQGSSTTGSASGSPTGSGTGSGSGGFLCNLFGLCTNTPICLATPTLCTPGGNTLILALFAFGAFLLYEGVSR